MNETALVHSYCQIGTPTIPMRWWKVWAVAGVKGERV